MVLGLKNQRFLCVNMPWNALQPQCLCGLAKIYTTEIYWYKFKKIYQFIYHLTEKIRSILRKNEKTEKIRKTPQTQYLRAFERI